MMEYVWICKTWLETDRNGLKLPKKWSEIAGSGQAWLEMARIGQLDRAWNGKFHWPRISECNLTFEDGEVQNYGGLFFLILILKFYNNWYKCSSLQCINHVKLQHMWTFGFCACPNVYLSAFVKIITNISK